MRRKDREVMDFEELIAIMKKCDVCRIALNDSGYPYILPLNFGLAVKDGRAELYFHGAPEGTKYELMQRDSRAGFEMDCGHELRFGEDNCSCTMDYESVIGRGHIEMVPDEEKLAALRILMEHYREGDFPFNPAVVAKTRVFKLVVEQMTGKIHDKKRRSHAEQRKQK